MSALNSRSYLVICLSTPDIQDGSCPKHGKQGKNPREPRLQTVAMSCWLPRTEEEGLTELYLMPVTMLVSKISDIGKRAKL